MGRGESIKPPTNNEIIEIYENYYYCKNAQIQILCSCSASSASTKLKEYRESYLEKYPKHTDLKNGEVPTWWVLEKRGINPKKIPTENKMPPVHYTEGK